MSVTEICFVNKSLSVVPVDVILFEPSHFFDKCTQRLPLFHIEQCSYGFSHLLQYDSSMHIQIRDAYGNFSPPLLINKSFRYIIKEVMGLIKLTNEKSDEICSIEVFNNLQKGAYDIILSRGKNITAIRSGLAPGEFFTFNVPDSFLARKISGTNQIKRLLEMENDGYSTMISMKDQCKGSLVLTGGGAGVLAVKYEFNFYKDNF